MYKKRVCIVFILIAIFSVSGALYSQDKKPEKLMIYQGTEWKAQLYGFVKLDAVYNDSSVLNPECPFWAFSDTLGNATVNGSEQDGSLTLSARTSRLGFFIWGPKALGANTMARFEFDFWGGLPDSGTSARQSEMRLRLAYVQLTWPTKTYLLAGNNWMLGTPGYCAPDMITFIPLAGAGLLFMREPQVAVGQTLGSKVFSITIEASVARAQGNDGADKGDYSRDDNSDFFNSGPRSTTGDNQLDWNGTGEASKRPSYKGRITLRINPASNVNIILGGSGQYMVEKHALNSNEAGIDLVNNSDGTAGADGLGDDVEENYTTEDVDSWYLQGFASFNLGIIRLSGHYFKGENIDTYFGGIAQGIHKTDWGTTDAEINPVESYAGWAELRIDLRPVGAPLTFSFGNGTEVVDEDTIGTGGRKENSMSWGNFWLYLNKNYMFGVEVAYIKTLYLGLESGDNWKVQSAFKFVF